MSCAFSARFSRRSLITSGGSLFRGNRLMRSTTLTTTWAMVNWAVRRINLSIFSSSPQQIQNETRPQNSTCLRCGIEDRMFSGLHSHNCTPLQLSLADVWSLPYTRSHEARAAALQMRCPKLRNSELKLVAYPKIEFSEGRGKFISAGVTLLPAFTTGVTSCLWI